MNKTNKAGFLIISLEECSRTYPFLLKNAQSHFRCAEALAAAKEYPNAIAHLILGTEELIKALALFLEAKGFQLRTVKGYKTLFSNHRVRHSIIKEFYSVILFVKKLVEIEKKSVNKHWFVYGLEIAIRGLEGVLDAGHNYQWWEQADSLKQHCFYVDYEDDVLVPSRLGVEDYEKSWKFVDAFQKDARLIILALNDLPEKKLDHLRETFREANFPALLRNTIRRSIEK